jgi:hypothetical protein
MPRILVTGSRDWVDRVAISRAIFRYLSVTVPMTEEQDENGKTVRFRDVSNTVIVHGAARGADLLTASWAAGCVPPIRTEAHPVTQADWQRNPRIAGYLRNSHMVSLGADVCIAFITPCRKVDCHRIEPHGSHGASHTADLAESQDIMTIRVPPR